MQTPEELRADDDVEQACSTLIDWALDQAHGRARSYWLNALESIRARIRLLARINAEEEAPAP